MICKECGCKYEGNFCPNCGTRSLDDEKIQVAPQTNDILEQEKPNSMKKIVIWAAAIIGGLFIVVLTIGITGERIDREKYIGMVKAGAPDDYPTISYEFAYENFFSDPKWDYFEAEDGENIVEFTGGCTYLDKDVDARIQFKIEDNGEYFQTSYLEFNGVPQSRFMIWGLQSAVFDHYGNNESSENDFSAK